MTGITASRVAGKTTEEFLLPETAAQVNANYRRCVEAGVPITYEEALDLPTGSRFFDTTSCRCATSPARSPVSSAWRAT